MKVSESLSRDILRLFIWFPFRWLTQVVPVRISFLMFRVMGDLHFSLSRGKKRNLALAMRERLGLEIPEALENVKRSFENHYTDRLHIFLYPRLNRWEKAERFVVFDNIEVLDEQLEKGRGALLVQPHFGPVQITLLALGLRGYKPFQIGYPSDKGLSFIGKNVAYRYRIKYEGMLPAPIIPADGFMGKVFRHLKNGGVTLTTGDGAGGGVYLGEHMELPFLGAKRRCPLGPATWALRTGASYLPTFIIPERYDRFRVVFEKPIEPRFDDPEKNRIDMTERFAAVAETYIRRYPYCWHFWEEVGSGA